jgi:hypothetical protein
VSTTTIGWVMDKDTSKRRLYLSLGDEGIGLTVEVAGQPSASVTLDAEGIEALYAYVGQAFVRVLVRAHVG